MFLNKSKVVQINNRSNKRRTRRSNRSQRRSNKKKKSDIVDEGQKPFCIKEVVSDKDELREE